MDSIPKDEIMNINLIGVSLWLLNGECTNIKWTFIIVIEVIISSPSTEEVFALFGTHAILWGFQSFYGSPP